MKRRAFLSMLGAAFATVAVATKLGETSITVPGNRLPDYLTDPDAWYIMTGTDEYGNQVTEQVLVARSRHSKPWKMISGVVSQ